MRSLTVACMLALSLFTGDTHAARSQVSAVTVGVGPAAIAVDSTRNLVFVTSARSNTIGVLDGSTRALLATIPRPAGQGVALAVDPVAGRLYDLDAALNQVLVWDETTHALVARWTVPAKPRGLAVDPVLRRVYVTSAAGGVGFFTALNESTGGRIISRQVGTDPRGIAVDPATGEAWVADAGTQVVYVMNAQLALEVNFYPVADGAIAVAIDSRPGATRVWVAGGRGVTVILPAKNIIAGTVGIGGASSAIAVNTATGRGYAISAGAVATGKGTLSVLEPSLTGSPAVVVEKVPVGASPAGVAVDLYNSRVFVASAGGDTDPGSVTVASAFEPLTHGFHFPNHFTGKPGGAFDLVATPFGLSGGMVYAALDTFNLGWRTPPDITPPALGSVREYLSKREVDSLGVAKSALVKRFHLWQSYPATGPTGLPQRSLGEFHRMLRPKLDLGVPVPVGVVQAAPGRPVWENREVLATGYFRRANQWVLQLYDPAAPNRTVYLSTATRRETLGADGTRPIGKAWRGFFAIATYTRATPPWARTTP